MPANEHVFDQLSKEMAAFAQLHHKDYEELRSFFLYELKLRCVHKSELRDMMLKLTDQTDHDFKGVS